MLRHYRDAVPCQFFWRKYAMFTIFYKIVGVLNPEVKYTKSQPISRALHAYADLVKVLPWVDVGAGGLGAGKTSGAGTRGVSLDVVIGVGTGYTNTNGGESSDNRSKVHAGSGPAENPSL